MPHRQRPALIGLILFGLFVAGCGPKGSPPAGGARGGGRPPAAGYSMEAMRKKHPTALMRQGAAPLGDANGTPPAAVRVAYGPKGLIAWIARPSGAGPPPGLVWGHGGF